LFIIFPLPNIFSTIGVSVRALSVGLIV
jgi:hypothetical protein